MTSATKPVGAGDYRARRRAALADQAQAGGLDGVLVVSWHRQTVAFFTGYAPGFVSNDAALWVGHDGVTQLGVRFGFEVTRASAVSGLPAVAITTAADAVPSAARRIGLIAGDVAVDETRPALSAALAERGIETVDLRGWFDDLQELKLPGEIAALRHGAQLCATAIAEWDTAPVGRTDWEIAAALEASVRRAGARRAVCLVGIGPGAVVTECTGRRVGATDSVGLELTAYIDEWCMHVNRQLPPSAEAPAWRAAREVCARTRGALIAAIRPGVAVDDVVAVGDRMLAEAGLLAAKEYDFGHGLAADTPTAPKLVPGTGRRIGANSVIAVHVAVRVPDGPTGFVGGPVLVGASDSAQTSELLPGAPWAVETAAALAGPPA